MRSNLDRLRAEHAEILTIAGEIEHLLEPRIVKKKASLLAGLVGEMAQRYAVCMGNIADSLKDYIRAWPDSGSIASSADAFCKDTKRLLEALETRINREEQTLYPKAELVN